MSLVFNPFTGNFDYVNGSTSTPNKLVYIDETITILTNTFLVLLDPQLDGTSEIDIQGTGELRVL